MRQSGTNLPKVGRYNRAVVLDRIQLADGISRQEIAQHTGLTAQTVSGIVRKLLDEGIVREDGVDRSGGGGRPRTRLRINPGAGNAVGLHFDPAELTCAVVDLLGRPLITQRRPAPLGTAPADVVAAMADLVRDVLAEADLPRSRVLGLGLACPGPIDQELGFVVEPPRLVGWNRVPLQRMLCEATGLPVTIDNDATAAAIGERWAGAGRGVANFAYFCIGTGVGGGLVLNHQVYRGGSLNAAEFGHTSVLEDGPQCYCGNRGCLETLVSPEAIVAETYRRLQQQPTDTVLLEPFRRDPDMLNHAVVRVAAADGDPVAAAVIDEAAQRVASVVVNVVNVTDVDLIVLGGRGIRHVEQRYVDAVATAVSTRPLSRHIRVVEVTHSPLGPDAAVVGGAALVLHHIFSPQLSVLLPN
ncbi:ROK family transcriptional regulator [Nocardia sp. CNY236]|uniref:ROK family transcriptional regulator n=1 Tax=Nocardia sp. CNY236 TaxID=1169152 RepID=UPI000490913B|nr:ROK family transcriptional regulator [Nocardia sp. CNY236]